MTVLGGASLEIVIYSGFSSDRNIINTFSLY